MVAWNQPYRILVHFNLPPELSGATVTSATLTLHFDGTWSGTDPEGKLLRVCRITRNWNEGSGAGGALTQDGVTWNEYNYFDGLTTTTNNWNTPGGDYTMTDSSSVSYDIWTYTSWTVTEIVQGWASNTYPNYGFLIKFDDESPSESIGVSFDSKETTETYGIPQLEITYVPASSVGGTGTLINISHNQTIMMMATTIILSTILLTVIFRARHTSYFAI
jgi:hypothetical protein